MKIFIILRGREFPLDVQEHTKVIELKKMISKRIGEYPHQLNFNGRKLDDFTLLSDYDVEDNDILQADYYEGGPALENSDYSTSINAVNKRDNIGNEYYYKIKGSNEGTVWGDHIYTDDSNIAKAAVLEGKCQLGQEIILGIKIIEGKNSYSCASKNGVSSVTYGSWPASYIFI